MNNMYSFALEFLLSTFAQKLWELILSALVSTSLLPRTLPETPFPTCLSNLRERISFQEAQSFRKSQPRAPHPAHPP